MEEKYTVIDNIIDALSTVRVSGEHDMNAQLGSIQTLRKLKELLQKEEAYNAGLIKGLQDNIAALQMKSEAGEAPHDN